MLMDEIKSAEVHISEQATEHIYAKYVVNKSNHTNNFKTIILRLIIVMSYSNFFFLFLSLTFLVFFSLVALNLNIFYSTGKPF